MKILESPEAVAWRPGKCGARVRAMLSIGAPGVLQTRLADDNASFLYTALVGITQTCIPEEPHRAGTGVDSTNSVLEECIG